MARNKNRSEIRQKKRKLTRRKFLRVAGTTAAGLVLWPWLPRTGAADVSEGLGDREFSFGCVAGDVAPDGAVVWLRGDGESSVAVQYGKDPGLTSFTATKAFKVHQETDFTAKIPIDGLEPKTTYYYRGVVLGKRPGRICRFVTAPRSDDPADVRFAFGGDSRERYKPFAIMDSIRAMRPDFFLHLGDTIYADKEGAASRLPQFWAKYRANRSDPPTQRLFAETSLYVTWDDHEVADNYHGAHPLAAVGHRAFFDYWPIRQDPKEPHRLYRSFRWGKAVELFILDTRQYRDPFAGTILGREQKRWFLDSLAKSTAWFKFVATSVPFSSPNRDKWGGFPEDRDAVLQLIESERIRGVIFLTADVHYAAVSKVPGESGLKEFIVGPLAAPLGRARGTAQRFEFFSKESYNFGMARVHAKADPPQAEIEIVDEGKKILYKTRIAAAS